MFKFLMDHDEMDIIIPNTFYLYEYQTHIIKMLMELKEIRLTGKNLHIVKQRFSSHLLILKDLQLM